MCQCVPGPPPPHCTFGEQRKQSPDRADGAGAAAQVVQEIKALRSSVTSHEREVAERATLVIQERLIKSKVRLQHASLSSIPTFLRGATFTSSSPSCVRSAAVGSQQAAAHQLLRCAL